MADAEAKLARFKEISNSAFDLKSALNFAKLKQEDIDNLREKVLQVDSVPKSILDHQVNANSSFKMHKKIYSFYLTFSYFHS
jgi:hypothetical protein